MTERFKWRPIKTVPKDGTRVLIYVSAYETLPGFITVAYYHSEGGWCADELRRTTHWMPLPKPPEEK